ncbi:MAG: M1 family peptidase [Terrimonas sp.]|nr:M1 family peptidase [Terrimonas sp.]
MKCSSILLSTLLFLWFDSGIQAQPLGQKKQFTRQDTLRGSNGPGRNWWDVLRYDITVKPDYASKTIEGAVTLRFKVTGAGKQMQIDLQEPMKLKSVSCDAVPAPFKREGNTWWISLPKMPKKNTVKQLVMQFAGHPREAVRPPWDGGWIWTKDQLGRPWISVACQGLGASVWYPCKDYQGDEPDRGASLSITVPDTLVAVGNGRLIKKETENQLTEYKWEVRDPINNYNIIPYIGKYVNWTDTLMGEKGRLDLSYWVLDYDRDKAEKQFGRDVKPMLRAFEYWFGPYPFYEDGYKLVEAPHLGMEHQSAVAYGNKFMNGYLGKDLSGTGWGLKWDFIIVHESGHEWFGNNITTKDIADMWVHEGFTNYSETLFTDYVFGKEAGDAYCQGSRGNIQNDKSIIGTYGVNQEGSGDMYSKGGNLLHTIRQVINDDEKFRQILRGLNRNFYHQTVTSQQVENYISQKSGIDFSKVFDQYLRTTMIPDFEYKISGRQLSYRWANVVNGFDLPLKISLGDGKKMVLKPTRQWQSISINSALDNPSISVDKNYYIHTKKLE